VTMQETGNLVVGDLVESYDSEGNSYRVVKAEPLDYWFEPEARS
jgi:hypothetical protein